MQSAKEQYEAQREAKLREKEEGQFSVYIAPWFRPILIIAVVAFVTFELWQLVMGQ